MSSVHVDVYVNDLAGIVGPVDGDIPWVGELHLTGGVDIEVDENILEGWHTEVVLAALEGHRTFEIGEVIVVGGEVLVRDTGGWSHTSVEAFDDAPPF